MNSWDDAPYIHHIVGKATRPPTVHFTRGLPTDEIAGSLDGLLACCYRVSMLWPWCLK